MKDYFLYQISDAVEEQINVSQLICVATMTKVNGQTIMDTNEQPALELFDEKSIEAVQGGWNILDGRTPVAFVEITEEGCDYRYYNRANKHLATVVKCLVFADSSVDGIVNPGLQIEVSNGIATCTNITTINGQLWSDAQANRAIQMKGFHYVVTKVSDGNFGSVKYLLEGNGYNQLGASRKEFETIAKQPNANADYVWTAKDQADAEEEVLAFNFIAAVKNETAYLRINFSQIFNS